jgi:ribosomal protein S18 acetylase RimI-like enzyme
MHLSELCSASDLDPLRTLNEELFPVHYSDQYYSALLDPALHVSILLLNEDHQLVGAATARFTEGEAYISTIGIRRDGRKQGLGTLLLKDIVQRIWNRGCTKITLHVKADNIPAIELYRKHGFQTTKRIKDHYYFQEQHHDALEMIALSPNKETKWDYCVLA